MKIGIFDSGIGGLSIAAKVWESFGSADIYYIADRKFAPYGELTEDEITQRVVWCGKILSEKKVEMIVVACNTATAAGIEILRQQLNIPIIGLEPDLHFYRREQLDISPEQVCVMCTSYTLKSSKFRRLKQRRDPENRMQYIGMKNLARLVEDCFWSGEGRTENEELVVNDLKTELQTVECKYLVLGCTHYELISNLIEKTTGLQVVGVADAIVKRMQELSSILKNDKKRIADSCGQFFYFDSMTKTWTKKEFQNFLSWPRG